MDKYLSPTDLKVRKYLSNVHRIGGAHVQCMNNHYPKFEYLGMKTGGVTIYTNQTPSQHFIGKMTKLMTPKNEKKHEMCTK